MSFCIKNKYNVLILQVLCGLAVVQAVWGNQSEYPWQMEGLTVVTTDQGALVQVRYFDWAGQIQLKDVAYHCAGGLSVYPTHQCEDGEVAFDYGTQSHQFKLSSHANWPQRTWSMKLSNPTEKIQLIMESQSTQATIELAQMSLTEMLALTNLSMGVGPRPDALFSGGVNFDWQQGMLSTPGWLQFSGLNYEYSDDVVLADLSGRLQFALDLNNELLSYEIQIDGGEMLFDQLYVDFSAFPVLLDGQVTHQEGAWYAVHQKAKNPQSMELALDIQITQELEWRQPQLIMTVFDSHHFNQQITNSILGIYGFGGSQMSGQFAISIGSDVKPFDHWTLDFDDYYFLNERRKMASESLSGQVHWQAEGQANDSTLTWQTLLLTGLPIGQAKAQFNFSGDQLQLLGEHVFPVFDGAIELKALQAQKLFSEFIDMDIQATLLPISLRLITEKMGWPTMSGSISGHIPGMVKRDSVIEFMGALQLQVFGGEMQIEHLSMERLFGVAPVIAGDVRFTGFDLSLLTETFGFGLISGRLHGTVSGLRITNWKTDRMNAQVYTVKTKGEKQIISQRAIENISSLGGIKGAISNTFLRFFDDFRYQKIKLSCRLHNSVCLIGGLKNQGNQFVIVEGGGIPKINIVGFVRAINWEEFISRLLNANYN